MYSNLPLYVQSFYGNLMFRIFFLSSKYDTLNMTFLLHLGTRISITKTIAAGTQKIQQPFYRWMSL